jgi:hypothetical protein
MLRFFLLSGVLAIAAACHTVPDPNDPARQKRIDDCLAQCGGGEPPRDNTAYQADPVAQRDTRTACEKRCHQIP